MSSVQGNCVLPRSLMSCFETGYLPYSLRLSFSRWFPLSTHHPLGKEGSPLGTHLHPSILPIEFHIAKVPLLGEEEWTYVQHVNSRKPQSAMHPPRDLQHPAIGMMCGETMYSSTGCGPTLDRSCSTPDEQRLGVSLCTTRWFSH